MANLTFNISNVQSVLEEVRDDMFGEQSLTDHLVVVKKSFPVTMEVMEMAEAEGLDEDERHGVMEMDNVLAAMGPGFLVDTKRVMDFLGMYDDIVQEEW
jgi:hypothetical protein